MMTWLAKGLEYKGAHFLAHMTSPIQDMHPSNVFIPSYFVSETKTAAIRAGGPAPPMSSSVQSPLLCGLRCNRASTAATNRPNHVNALHLPTCAALILA